MSASSSILISLGLCIVGAILEGLTAGNNIKPLFARLRFPPYSPPLWAWYIIGALYYVTCFVIFYRLFRYKGDNPTWNAAFILILIVVAMNALWNYVFFRAQSVLGAFLFGFPYALIVIALFVSLIRFDEVAAWGVGTLLDLFDLCLPMELRPVETK